MPTNTTGRRSDGSLDGARYYDGSGRLRRSWLEFYTRGETPHWFNYAVRHLWKLVGKNTKLFALEGIQPVLDDIVREKSTPPFIQSIRLRKYNIGTEAPQLANLKPVPSRSLSELQFRYDLEFQSSSELEFDVEVDLSAVGGGGGSGAGDDAQDEDVGGDDDAVREQNAGIGDERLVRQFLPDNETDNGAQKETKRTLQKDTADDEINLSKPSNPSAALGDDDETGADDTSTQSSLASRLIPTSIIGPTTMSSTSAKTNTTSRTTVIPVSLSSLKVKARLWSSLTLQPYPPYCAGWTYGLLQGEEPPLDVDFEFSVGAERLIPVTSLPVLREVFFSMMTNEIPKQFTLPNTNTVLFLPPEEKAKLIELTNMSPDDVRKLPEQELRGYVPELWNFFQSLDEDEDGMLSLDELISGLSSFGYTAEEARKDFDKLTANSDDGSNRRPPSSGSGGAGTVTFQQFVAKWDEVQADKISEDYEGVLSFRIGPITNLTSTATTTSNTVVEITLGNETVAVSYPAASEEKVYELKAKSLDEHLEVKILNDPPNNLPLLQSSSRVVVARADMPLSALLLFSSHISPPADPTVVDLEPHGRIELELAYERFIDRWEDAKTTTT